MSILSNRLREVRKELKISQGDASDYLNISRSAYSQYETGNRNPDWNTIARLADFFHISSDYLIGRTDDKKAVISGEFAILSEEQIKLLKLFQRFTAIQKAQFFGYAERVLEENDGPAYSAGRKR